MAWGIDTVETLHVVASVAAAGDVGRGSFVIEDAVTRVILADSARCADNKLFDRLSVLGVTQACAHCGIRGLNAAKDPLGLARLFALVDRRAWT